MYVCTVWHLTCFLSHPFVSWVWTLAHITHHWGQVRQWLPCNGWGAERIAGFFEQEQYPGWAMGMWLHPRNLVGNSKNSHLSHLSRTFPNPCLGGQDVSGIFWVPSCLKPGPWAIAYEPKRCPQLTWANGGSENWPRNWSSKTILDGSKWAYSGHTVCHTWEAAVSSTTRCFFRKVEIKRSLTAIQHGKPKNKPSQ